MVHNQFEIREQKKGMRSAVKRILSCAMAAVMHLAMMPTTALAAGEQGQVTITKSLVSETPDADGNYTIKLTVQGNPIAQNVESNADVVLVVDCSGSMEEPYRNPRIDTAKAAGQVFANGILTDNSNNRMAVIGFSSREFSFFWGWFGNPWSGNPIKVKTDLTADMTTISNAISRMRAGGGTDYTSALQEAYNILDGRSDKTRPGYVIFISDGAPGLNGESQGNPNWNGSEQIRQLKNDGITIYTIGIALGDEPANYMRGMATSSDHFINISDANLQAQLSGVLSSWATQINSIPAGTNAVMTDVINSEFFEYVSADEALQYDDAENKLTWQIGEITEAEKSATFKIKPKGDWTGAQNTNLSCVLTYTDPEDTEHTLQAESPKVTLEAQEENTVNIPFVKEWKGGDAINIPERIVVNLTANGDPVDEMEVTAETQWSGTFVDRPMNDAAGSPISYGVTEEPVDNYTAAYTAPTDGAGPWTITNTYNPPVQYTSVAVQKVWEHGNNQNVPASVQVQLIVNGQPQGELITLDSANEWKYVWQN